MAKVKRQYSKLKEAEEAATAEEALKGAEVDSENVYSSSEDELDDKMSEDELDELDEAEEEEAQVEEEAETDESDLKKHKPNDSTEKSAQNQEAHAEQKKLLKERKLKRVGGVQIEEIKSLWERLRKKGDNSGNIRSKLCDEIWSLAQNCVKDLVLKHDASRVIQTLVKYAKKQVRSDIVKELKGSYLDLAKSPYGKFLLVKLLHYGDRGSRDIIFTELQGNFRKLLRHKEGAHVLEDIFVLYASGAQKKRILQEFWGAKYAMFGYTDKSANNDTVSAACAVSTEARGIIAGNLIQTITAAVGKGSTGFQVLHAVMQDYVAIASSSEMTEFVDLLQDQVAELVHTPQGCDVACCVVAAASAKQRKQIIKNLKSHFEALVTNEHGNTVLLTIFMTVDDTVLVAKSFPVDGAILARYACHKYARRPFLYLLCGLDGKYFSPHVAGMLQKYTAMSEATSKKPQATRRAELLAKYASAFYDSVQQAAILEENMGLQFVNEVVVHVPTTTSRDAAIDAVLNAFPSAIELAYGSRLYKSLIQGGVWKSKTQKVESDNSDGIGSTFARKLVGIVSGDLVSWVESANGVFVIAALYEKLKEDKESKEFIKAVGKFKKLLKAKDDKGSKLLLDVL